MTGDKGFVRELKDEIGSSAYVMRDHPLVQGMLHGSISLRQARGWACQDSHYRRAVPRLAMLRYLRCSDPEIQQRLGGVVAEETAGADTKTAGHFDLFLRFSRAIGLADDEVERSAMLPATAAHIYWAELITYTLPWFVAMSAQLAGEAQAPEAMPLVAEGLQQHYGLTAEQSAFFSVHGNVDEDHGSLIEDIIARYIVTPELQAQTRAIIQRKLELQWDMWSTYQAFEA